MIKENNLFLRYSTIYSILKGSGIVCVTIACNISASTRLKYTYEGEGLPRAPAVRALMKELAGRVSYCGLITVQYLFPFRSSAGRRTGVKDS